MKLRNIAIATAAVVATMSAGAAGLLPADQNALKATITAGNYISIAGASAIQSGFDLLIASVLKNPVFYIDDAAASTSVANASYLAVSGTLLTPVGNFTSGTQVVIHYRTAGGSFNGIYPVARATAIDALDVRNCSSTLGLGTSASPYVCVVRGPVAHSKTAALDAAGLVPDAGVSDVDPSFFTVADNLEGETPATALTASEIDPSNLTATPLYVQGFGIPMTWNLALSSMTKPIYSAIMTGAFTDWSTVPNSGSSGPIVICRRIPGSGTQAVTNLYAGNTGCTAVATPTVDRSNSTGGAFTPSVGTTPGNWNIVGKTTGLFVVEGNGSGDVRKCMDAAYFGGSYTTKDRDSKLDLTVNFGAGGYKAIGVLSLDSLSNSVLTAGTPPTPTTANYGKANGAWQFRALSGNGTITGAGITAATATTPVQPAVSGTTKADGILPTTANIANGDWDLIGIESYNVPARTTGDKLAVVNAVSSAAQSAHVLRTIPALSWASLSLPDSITFNTTLAADNANVVKATNANNSLCAPLQRQY